MDQREFHDLTEATVTRLLPRIPAKYVGGFEAELDGGEYAMAVENLVLTLVNDQVPVSADEREDLRRLLDHLQQPAGDLERLVVTG